MVEHKLGIFIITYNRAALLKRTLTYLANSLLRNYSITVVDNASTDDTEQVITEMSQQLPNLIGKRNKVNVGANANFLKAFDYSSSEYTWILCDDDNLDLTHFSDVLQVIAHGKADLIHVGAHRQKTWPWGGSYKTTQELLAAGYAYFKFASFMPCNIYKTNKFIKEYLVPGYNNIGNAYPHMPFAFGLHANKVPIYVAEQQVVFAQETGQSYTPKQWYLWWMKTCELLKEPAEVRQAYLNQWMGDADSEAGLQSLLDARRMNVDNEYISYFISRYFPWQDRLKLTIWKLRNDFFWFRFNLKQKTKFSSGFNHSE